MAQEQPNDTKLKRKLKLDRPHPQPDTGKKASTLPMFSLPIPKGRFWRTGKQTFPEFQLGLPMKLYDNLVDTPDTLSKQGKCAHNSYNLPKAWNTQAQSTYRMYSTLQKMERHVKLVRILLSHTLFGRVFGADAKFLFPMQESHGADVILHHTLLLHRICTHGTGGIPVRG